MNLLYKKTTTWFFAFLSLVFLFHLFFLKADPNVRIAFNSVDAFTDEGLYTSQLRNFIHHGHLDIKEGDALLKAPLFNVLLAPALFIFGTHLSVARLTVLLAGMFIIGFAFFKNRSLRPVIFIFSVISLGQFHLFHYMHLSMADSLGSLCIVAGVLFAVEAFFFMATYGNSTNSFQLLLPSFLFFTAAIYLKNSFAPSVLLFNLAIPGAAFFAKESHINYKDALRASLVLAAASLLLYYLVWYLPLHDFFSYIMSKETAERFAKEGQRWKLIKENYTSFFHSPELKYMMYVFYFSLILTPFVWIRSKSPRFRFFIFCIIVWLLIESPKLATYWVPARYLLPAICAIMLYIAVVVTELFAMAVAYSHIVYSHVWRWAAIMCMTFLFVMNIFYAVKSFNSRKYFIQNMNNIVAASLAPDDTMIGPWAPTFAWETKARAIPVWENYLNDSATLERFRPRIVAGEEQLDSMFARRNTPLREISDSSFVINFHIRDHKAVTVHWLKKEYWEKAPK